MRGQVGVLLLERDIADLLGWLRHVKVCTLQLGGPGPSGGNPMGRMEGVCGVNTESENAEYRTKHHLAWKGPGNDVKTHGVYLCRKRMPSP